MERTKVMTVAWGVLIGMWMFVISSAIVGFLFIALLAALANNN